MTAASQSVTSRSAEFHTRGFRHQNLSEPFSQQTTTLCQTFEHFHFKVMECSPHMRMGHENPPKAETGISYFLGPNLNRRASLKFARNASKDSRSHRISISLLRVTSIRAGRWIPLLHWPMQLGLMLAVECKMSEGIWRARKVTTPFVAGTSHSY
jgi:hypothetical protein